MKKNKLVANSKVKKRGRPRKNLEVPVPTKRRGRPPKTETLLKKSKLPAEPKKKRGRPPKTLNKQSNTPLVTKKRGRPPKQQLVKPEGKEAVDKSKDQNKVTSLAKDFVEAKAFLNRKESSKQIPEYKMWLDKFNQTVADNDSKKLIEIIPELSKIINKKLEEESFKDQIQVHICLIRLMVDDEIRAVEFDPFEKGIKCKIFYNLKGLPIGLAKKQKDDLVCNKITSVLEKFVPIGFCC